MKNLFLVLVAFLCVSTASAQYIPSVTVDQVTLVHEQKGWRVTNIVSTPTMAIRYNLAKNDLIVRIDGKNASETGPMQMASLFNMGFRRNVNVFVERGSERMEILLRKILVEDYTPVAGNPFRHVAVGFSAPDFSLEDIDHHTVSLEQYKGKWLLIDFVATWCAPCMSSFPQVVTLARQSHVDLLLVAIEDKEPALRHLRQQYHLDAPIAMVHWQAPLPVAFGITTNQYTGQVPALALIDPDGDVAMVGIGGDPKQVAIQVAGYTTLKEKPAVQ